MVPQETKLNYNAARPVHIKVYAYCQHNRTSKYTTRLRTVQPLDIPELQLEGIEKENMKYQRRNENKCTFMCNKLYISYNKLLLLV